MARKTTTTETPTTNADAPKVTFTPEALQAVIAEAVAQAMAKQKAEAVAVPAIGNGRSSDRSMQNEIAVVKAFKKAGFGNVKPHEDVRTFNRWVAQGFRPIEGSKSLKIKNLRLFHKRQVRPITSDERAKMVEQQKAAIDRHVSNGGSVVQLNPQGALL
jgi:hypothetical protein